MNTAVITGVICVILGLNNRCSFCVLSDFLPPSASLGSLTGLLNDVCHYSISINPTAAQSIVKTS